jgi:hypothetical protein
MTICSPPAACTACYELRFTALHDRGRGFAFPCDAVGHVAIDGMSDSCRNNYFYARTVIGRELSAPVVALVRL